MRANVIHTDLNPCGGAEQLSLGTIQALIEMDYEVELTLARPPDIARLKKAFGEKRVGKLFDQVKRINSLGRLPIGNGAGPAKASDGVRSEYDIQVNTHGDMLPYFLPNFSAKNAITYCHYPVAINLIDSQDATYAEYLANSGLIGREVLDHDEARGRLWQDLRRQFLKMLGSSVVITNSNFSKRAIMTHLVSGNSRPWSEPMIISPPVNIEEFRPELYSDSRSDLVLVVSRVHPSKMLENAINAARILKQQRIGKGMIIAGNLMDDDPVAVEYHRGILYMIRKFGLSDYVTVETNVSLTELKSMMRKCKVYFHPLPGEPFGISIIEAMSAGLIAVVPGTGGHTEFVSKKYHFDSLAEASGIISSAFIASQVERTKVSDSVAGFSLSQYLMDFQRVVKETLAAARMPSIEQALPSRSRQNHARDDFRTQLV